MAKETFKKIKKNRAFVILFAVTISAILLSITLGVTNIAFREIKFSTSAKDSNNAFFAADAGLECAMVYEKSSSTVFRPPFAPSSISCLGGEVLLTELIPSSKWSFTLSGLGNGGQGCAIVTVDKTDVSPDPETIITSKGYDIGDSECLSINPNRVERQIELSY